MGEWVKRRMGEEETKGLRDLLGKLSPWRGRRGLK
jgi:hypothetical protein